MELLRDKGMNDVTILIGGIIPEADIPAAEESRHRRSLSCPAPPTQSIVDFIRQRVPTAPRGV